MAYCINCGGKLTKEALYCARCGVKTAENIEAGKAAPSDEMREALTQISREMEKAFNIAAVGDSRSFSNCEK